jgi:redox-sensing transcriptional repressor
MKKLEIEIEIETSSISRPTLNRLPNYLNYLKIKQKEGVEYISSTVMAEDLKQNPVQVRKDLALTGSVGKPKTGFEVNTLIDDIIEILGYNNTHDAILVGAGQLGKTLLSYNGFSNYGLNILAAFDVNKLLHNTEVNGKKIFPLDKMKNLIERLNVHIGIITVPAKNAQEVCDLMIEYGIRAIWNFAPTHLDVPDNIIVQNENMAASLAILSNKLAESMIKDRKNK